MVVRRLGLLFLFPKEMTIYGFECWIDSVTRPVIDIEVQKNVSVLLIIIVL